MRQNKKTLTRKLLTAALTLSMLFVNLLPVKAQENNNYDAQSEYQERLAAGDEVYEIVDNDGTFIGYYEEGPSIMPRYGSSVNWTIGANTFTWGSNSYSLSNGHQITVNISQSTTGESYIVLVRPDTKVMTRLLSTKTTNGWNSVVITLAGITADNYAFGIANYSSKSITYSGTYSL